MRNSPSHSRPVVLPPILDLDSLESVRDTLLDALEQGPVSIQSEGLERISTNGVFLLLSAGETARRNGFECRIEGAGAALVSAVERLGLGAEIAPMMGDE